MPNVPDFRDLERSKRTALDKFSFKNVIGLVQSYNSAPQLPPAPAPALTLNPGLFGVWYGGYFAGDPAWFATATPIGSGYKQSTCGERNSDQNTSWQWTGYFKPSVDGNFKFRGYGDDYLLVWFGDNAKDGNFNLNNVALSSYANQESFTQDLLDLKSDTYYPVRLQWGHPPVITYNGMYLSLLSAGETYPDTCQLFDNWFYDQTLDNPFWGNNVMPGVTAIGLLSAAWVPVANAPEITYSSTDTGTTDITMRLPSGTTTQVITAVLTNNGMDYTDQYGFTYPTALWEPYNNPPTYDGGAGSQCRITWNNVVIFEQIDGSTTVYKDYVATNTINTLRPCLSAHQSGVMKVVIETVNSSLSAGLRFWYD